MLTAAQCTLSCISKAPGFADLCGYQHDREIDGPLINQQMSTVPKGRLNRGSSKVYLHVYFALALLDILIALPLPLPRAFYYSWLKSIMRILYESGQKHFKYGNQAGLR